MATIKLTEKAVAALPPATNHAAGCAGADACKCALRSYHWDTELRQRARLVIVDVLVPT